MCWNWSGFTKNHKKWFVVIRDAVKNKKKMWCLPFYFGSLGRKLAKFKAIMKLKVWKTNGRNANQCHFNEFTVEFY